jgi:hypothetical protein
VTVFFFCTKFEDDEIKDIWRSSWCQLPCILQVISSRCPTFSITCRTLLYRRATTLLQLVDASRKTVPLRCAKLPERSCAGGRAVTYNSRTVAWLSRSYTCHLRTRLVCLSTRSCSTQPTKTWPLSCAVAPYTGCICSVLSDVECKKEIPYTKYESM